MQGWEYIKGKQICTFYKKNKENKENLIIFFHGLGQHKAGAYFIFTQIAREIKDLADTFQFDFYGCGDSEGELNEVYFEIWMQEGEYLINKYIQYYYRIVIITSGIGTAIANKIIKKYNNVYGIHIDYSNIKLMEMDSCKEIFEYEKIKYEYIDTSCLFNRCRDAEKFFLILGSWMNRSKGLYMSVELLKDMMKAYDMIEITEREYIISSDYLYNEPIQNNIYIVHSKSILTDVKIREQLGDTFMDVLKNKISSEKGKRKR